MDPLLFFAIAGALLALVAGGTLGFVIGSAAGRKKARQQPEALPAVSQPIPAPPPREEETSLTPPAALTERSQPDFHPVACIWRNHATGVLATEIKGKLYPEFTALSAVARKRLQELGQEWAAWMGIAGQPAQAAGMPSQPAREEAASVRTPAPEPLPVSLEHPGKVVEKGAERAPKPRAKSIAEQIDEILQARLVASHQEHQAIRITEDPERGVSVWVGLKRYNSIDEVAEPEALRLIREAVTEWERVSADKRQG